MPSLIYDGDENKLLQPGILKPPIAIPALVNHNNAKAIKITPTTFCSYVAKPNSLYCCLKLTCFNVLSDFLGLYIMYKYPHVIIKKIKLIGSA